MLVSITQIVIIRQIFTTLISAALPDCQQHFQQFPNNFQPNDSPNNATLSQTNDAYSLLEDTKQCDELLQQKLLLANENLVPACFNELIDVDLIPHSVFPIGSNILPFIQLNISLAGRTDQLNELFFQFRCLYAPNLHDYLCHNHKIQQQKWGRMIWPCRRLELRNNTQHFSYRFSYNCFHLFSQSQYAVEFLIVQRNQKICRKTFYLTIPSERQLDPKIGQFYKGNSKNEDELGNHQQLQKWSPLISLDNSPKDTILINLNPAEWIQPNRHINISIYLRTENDDGNGKMQLVLSERIFPIRQNASALPPHSNALSIFRKQRYRWRWADIDVGEYTIYAFLDDAHCQLKNCAAQNDEGGIVAAIDGCKLCPFTMLNFTVTEPKYSMAWRRTLTLIRVGKYTGIIVFVILIGTFLSLIATFYYVRYWKPRVVARQRPRSMELLNRPSVLVLYTDDCQPHSDAVMALCQTLEEAANARCIVDQIEFVENPALRPSIWLMEKLAECDFVIVIFSECSPRILQGERMAQRRHFPDYFNTAIGFVSAKINEIASKEGVPKLKNGGIHGTNSAAETSTTMTTTANSRLNRFIFARLAYSPPSSIPTFFASTQFGGGGPLVLPQQIGPLIARLHGILNSNNGINANGDCVAGRFEHQADLGHLNAAIREFDKFVGENPNWMAERFLQEKGEEVNKGKNTPTMSPNSSTMQMRNTRNEIPTLAEQSEMAEQFGLLGPEEQDLDDENNEDAGQGIAAKKKYALIGSVEDYDDDGSTSSLIDG